MSWPFSALGLDVDADERAIKRAYAAGLKTVRPDEDPEGFQRLNEAYRAALAHAAARAAWQASDAEDIGHADDDVDENEGGDDDAVLDRPVPDLHAHPLPPASAAEDAHAPPALAETTVSPDLRDEPPFDPERLIDACLSAAHDGDPRVIAAWLQSQPDLWSIDRKAWIGQRLFRGMIERNAEMPGRNFDEISKFFGYEDLHTGQDPMLMAKLRQRMNDAWKTHRREYLWQRANAPLAEAGAPPRPPPGQEESNHRFRIPSGTGTPLNWMPAEQGRTTFEIDPNLRQRQREAAFVAAAGRSLAHLLKRQSKWTLLWQCLNPFKSIAAGRLLRAFGGPDIDLNALPACVDRVQASFWRDVSAPGRLHRRRVLVWLWRSTAATLFMGLLIAIGFIAGSEEVSTIGDLHDTATTLATVFATACVAFGAIEAWRSFIHWQSLPDPRNALHRWLHRLVVPGLLGGAVLASMQQELTSTPFLVLGLALTTSILRNSGRNGAFTRRIPMLNGLIAPLQRRPIAVLLLIPVLSSMLVNDSVLLLVLLTSILLTIGLWIDDLRKQQRKARTR